MHATDVRTALEQQRKEKAQTSWWGILTKTFSEFGSDDAMTWAAAVACYTLLALAPLLVVAIKVGSVVLGSRAASGQISNQVTQWMGGAAGQAINEIVSKASQPGHGRAATIISLILSVFSATGVFAELQAAMNRIWKVKQKPGRALLAFVQARGLSLMVVVVAAILLVASVVATTWLQHLSILSGGGRYLKWVIDVVVSVGVLTLLFAFMFRALPDAQIEWRSTWVGAVLTAVLFTIGKYGLALYFRFGAPASAFGAVGSLAAVLIWIFYSAQIFFFGAEFTYVYAQARGHAIAPSRHARPLTKFDETESATPSNKPPPPGAPSANAVKRREIASPYSAVLGPHARSGARKINPQVLQQLAQHQATVRSYLAAGAGLAVGALIGGYGALQARREAKPNARDVAAARLDDRIRHVERKVGHVSRIQRFVEQENVIDRIEQVEHEIRDAARKARRAQHGRSHDGSWVNRTVRKVKDYF